MSTLGGHRLPALLTALAAASACLTRLPGMGTVTEGICPGFESSLGLVCAEDGPGVDSVGTEGRQRAGLLGSGGPCGKEGERAGEAGGKGEAVPRVSQRKQKAGLGPWAWPPEARFRAAQRVRLDSSVHLPPDGPSSALTTVAKGPRGSPGPD